MSIKSQQQNMQLISRLISRDLGNIYGEKESGPNGAKKEFLSKSAAFLRVLGNDLGFKEFKVTKTPQGIAVSGEVTLIGLWGDGNGLYFKIDQPLLPFDGFQYRSIQHMKDYSGGRNQWLPCSVFGEKDYETLLDTLTALRRSDNSEVDKVAA